MPLIIPDDIEHFTTAGEEIFCRFLRTVAKPDDQYIVWYSPDINESEPDFILYCPAYVGITRARYQLEIPFVRKSPLMERLFSSVSSSVQ